VHALFNPGASPPQVPSPNDLAINPSTGLVSVSGVPGANGTVAPVDQEIASYLGQLNGFSPASTATATFDGALDPATVNTQTVRVYDVSGAAPALVPGTIVAARNGLAGSFVAEVDVSPPLGGWIPGHDYAVILVAGANGLKGQGDGGVQVYGTPTWVLVRQTKPLLTCQGTNCTLNTNLIPSTFTNPQEREADQLHTAAKLEQIRLGYAPLFQFAEAQGISRTDVPLLWTFRIESNSDLIAYTPSGPLPSVPSPNNLAINPATGLLNVPPDPRTSSANQEFTQNYLGSLDGYPPETAGGAQVVGPAPLDAGSVTPATVVILDVTVAPDGGSFAPPVTPAVYVPPPTNSIALSPPTGGWLKAHTYAVAIVGGAHGVMAAPASVAVLPDLGWVLLRGSAPLVDCATLAPPPACHSVVTAVTLSDTDAVTLEGARRALAPVIAGLSHVTGSAPENLLAGWVFSITDQNEVEFDPANNIIPFPNDLLRVSLPDGGGLVQLPNPTNNALITGLNTLDGFSTIAPLASQNGVTGTGVLVDPAATVSPDSLPGNTGLVKLTTGYTMPTSLACLSDHLNVPADGGCAVHFSLQADGGPGSYPQQLLIAPTTPLDERTTYGAYLTTGLKDSAGKTVIPTVAFALLRMANPLVDSSGNSKVLGVSNAQAQALEPVRQALHPAIAGILQATGLTEGQLALAWGFTTVTSVSEMALLHNVPEEAAQKVSATLAAVPVLTDISSTHNNVANFWYGNGAIGSVFIGRMSMINLLDPTTGAFNPAGTFTPEQAIFTLETPKGAPPSGGFPVVIFAHGITDWRGISMSVANALADAGFATIAVDEVWHGDRSSCIGSAAVIGNDNTACAVGTCDETTGKCNGSGASVACTDDVTCLSQRLGLCDLSTGVCQGGDLLRDGDVLPDGGPSPTPADPLSDVTGRPKISGWNFIQALNPFATRDNLRQAAVDYAQVANVISFTGTGSLNQQLEAKLTVSGDVLNPQKIYFLGKSLGGVTGTLYSAVAPEVVNTVLNVPGGNLPDIVLTSPSFASVAAGLQAVLTGQGMPPGTVAYDQFLRSYQWALDPADPSNFGYGVLHPIPGGITPNPGRKAFIYFIQDDQVIPNSSTLALINATNNRPGETNLCAVKEETPSLSDIPLEFRHSFLTGAGPASSPTELQLTLQAQSNVATFLSTGAVP
jgi:hypothetical protein